jgi:hypothetical protein
MTISRIAFFTLVGCLAFEAPRAEQPLHSVAATDICVTNGAIAQLAAGGLMIDTPSSRAVLKYGTLQAAEIRFRYLGPSVGSKALASGELRRQIGLKLQAQDTCNLVYAMWHIEPDSRIAVSIKRNAGMNMHDQCHANGYMNLNSTSAPIPPKIATGVWHVLRAELNKTVLTVRADGAIAWQGDLGPLVMEFDGPIGLRTDNARFEFELFAGPQTAAANEKPSDSRCAPTQGD